MARKLAHQWYDQTTMETEIVNAVDRVTKARGVPMALVAITWAASRPGITEPIVGTSKPHHLADAVAGIELHLTAEEVTLLESPSRPRPVAGHD